MTELKLLPCPFCGAKPKWQGKGCDTQKDYFTCPEGHTRDLDWKEWNTRSPQSITEKVKWPDKLKKCDAIYHSSDCECAEIEAYNKAIDLCKQSLNQASEEDREKLANRFQKFDILAEDILEGKTFCVLSLEKCYEIADALKKEYILIKREK